ncbi:WD repeat-containing protein 12 [Entophlyctis luteolus]|nr:WD repeat-containing protein 12 [Entophlyctis luteolus]
MAPAKEQPPLAAHTDNAPAPPDQLQQQQQQQQQQVQIRLHTRQQKYRIGADDSVLLMVPAHLRRFNLSEIVNTLLNNDRKVPFDFIIAGKFLRSTLREYLAKNSISSEATVDVEYVLSSVPPKPTAAMQHDDWIASIAGPATTSTIATACCDGNVRIWNLTGQCVAVLNRHTRSAKAVAWLAGNSAAATLLSGGEDQSVVAWQHDGRTNSSSVLFECLGHKGSIDCLSVNVARSHFATASFDKTVKIWTSSTTDDTIHIHQSEVSGSSKKKRLDDHSIPVKDCVQSLDAHEGGASTVEFSRSDGETTVLFSGGADHVVRVWDIEKGANSLSMSCGKVVLGLAHSSHARLLASGHTDSAVRLWDPRDHNGLVVKLRLVSHKSWVPAVAWSPANGFLLASGSYDGSIKVWDIRSTTPLHNLRASDDGSSKKVLAVAWEDGCLFSGGEEGVLRVHDMQQPQE